MSDSQFGMSLYDRIGGAQGVVNLVDRFYARVIADPDLLPYFDHVALDKLRHMQVEFFTAALDGPLHYTGTPIVHAHQGRGIKRQHFQAFVEHGCPLASVDGLAGAAQLAAGIAGDPHAQRDPAP